MKTKTTIVLSLILGILLSGCSTKASTNAPLAAQTSSSPTGVSSKAVTLKVFAAASLTESFGEIGMQFETQYPGATVALNFAGSQQLAQQLADGAPADVFASANQTQMDSVIQSGRIVSGTTQTFVKNRLVVIYPKANLGGLVELRDLGKPGLKVVLAAKEVPVGQYTLNFLDKAAADQAFGPSFKDGVLNNVVSYENDVKAVLTKVVLGEADAGVVYSSDVSGDSVDKVGEIEIPDALNVVATYPIAVVQDSPNPDMAQAFVNYVLSPDGQATLAKYGFIPVKK